MTLGDRLGLVEHAGEVRVGEAPLVRRRGVLAAIRQIDVAGVDGGEFRDHGLFSRWVSLRSTHPANCRTEVSDDVGWVERSETHHRRRPTVHLPSSAMNTCIRNHPGVVVLAIRVQRQHLLASDCHSSSSDTVAARGRRGCTSRRRCACRLPCGADRRARPSRSCLRPAARSYGRDPSRPSRPTTGSASARLMPSGGAPCATVARNCVRSIAALLSFRRAECARRQRLPQVPR